MELTCEIFLVDVGLLAQLYYAGRQAGRQEATCTPALHVLLLRVTGG